MERLSDTVSKIIEVPPVDVPESMMFGYPTRMVDAWTPSVERIMMPRYSISARRIHLSIKYDCLTCANLPSARHLGVWPDLKRTIRRRLAVGAPPLSVTDSLAIDFRHLDAGNLAHFVHRVVLVCKIFLENLHEIADFYELVAIFPDRPSELTVRLVEYFKLNAIFTDAPVRGNVIEISDENNDPSALYGLIPLLEDYPLSLPNSEVPSKIFISRKGSRLLENDDEVAEYLEGVGYTRVYFEDIDLSEQFAMGRNASHVVAIHGAALGVLAFNNRALGPPPRRKLRLVEMFSPAFVVSPFRQYIAALEGKWVGVRGQVTPEIVSALDNWQGVSESAYQPFEVDIESLRMALEYIEI